SDGSFEKAVGLLWTALGEAADDHVLLVQTLLLLSNVLITTRAYDESLHHTRQAVALAEEINCPALTSQALAMWVMVSCMCGQGATADPLMRALALDPPTPDAPPSMPASAVYALVLAWTGRLDEARTQMHEVRRRCSERGEESLLMLMAPHAALIEIWR